MSNDAPLLRQWSMLTALGSRRLGLTIREMAEELGVHVKTIRRDLETFRSVGFPLEETTGERGRKTWRIKTQNGQPEMSFAFDEALALYLGRRFLQPLAGTHLGEAASRAFQKVRACLGSSATKYVDQMAGRLYFSAAGDSDYSQKAELLDRLLIGVEERKATHIVYQSQRATDPVTYEVFPYGIAWHRGSLYLVAFSRDHKELRHFKVDRIEEVEISAFPFQMPADFDLQQHLANSFGVYHGAGDERVKVRFAHEVARFVQEKRWHPSQQLTEQRDGSLIAEFRLSSLVEIKSWILSFGRHAEVLAPKDLRDTVRDELLSALEKYEPSNSGIVAARRRK